MTGPTGSGKTTTLYSCLRCLDGAKMNISTVEDPVEYHLGFANQIQVHERIGMTFAAALRGLLRQDPDVIMLGEIRDQETAQIAVQASLTGHLVLSTLHTNDAPSSHHAADQHRRRAVPAQRRASTRCWPSGWSGASARTARSPCRSRMRTCANSWRTHGFDPDKIFKGRGCDKCRNTGYRGRMGIYELLVLDDVARDLVVRNPNVTELRRICKERGMVTPARRRPAEGGRRPDDRSRKCWRRRRTRCRDRAIGQSGHRASEELATRLTGRSPDDPMAR